LSYDVKALVQRCLDGDQDAIRLLVRQYQGQVFGLCFRMLSHRQDAEDVAQETFARVIRHLHTWDGDRPFEPWLLAIAGNRCRTHLARRGKRPRAVELIEVSDDRPADLQAARQLAEELQRALAGLREEYRQAFRLFHEQQRSYAEIGQILDCPVGTVKTWVHRARGELVNQLRSRKVVEEVRHAVRKF
jgi:RNA polymerase sigma-70 factor (ECF subfamily)